MNAFERREPAEIGWASTELADEVFNRRWFMKDGTIPPDPFGSTSDQVRMNPPAGSPDLVKPSGPVDPEVLVLSIRTVAGEPLAVLANYSLHYVGNIPAGLVSADYFGEFSRAIATRLGAGERFVGILSNGTSGNINNIDFTKRRPRKQPFEQVRHVAGKLADAVAGGYGEIEHSPGAKLAMEQAEVRLMRRKPTRPILEQSRAILQDISPSELTRRHIYAQRAIDLHNGPDSVSVVLQAIGIGDLGIAALPFETFVETGLAIKRASPFQETFVISLANGAEGYLPTPDHHALGGYETWLGTSRVEIQASETIEEQLLSSLHRLATAVP